MKSTTRKILAGGIVVALSGITYAFTKSKDHNEPVFKNYEVIRLVNGEVTVFDTTLSASATYSPDDYLKTLGFNEDDAISIIDIRELAQNQLNVSSTQAQNIDKTITHIDFSQTEEVKTTVDADGNEVIVIEKNVNSFSSGDTDVKGIELDVNSILAEINIDSIINTLDKDATSDKVIMSKVIISNEDDGETSEEMNWSELDLKDADYSSETGTANNKKQVAIWGDGENHTLVIVSDASPKKSDALATQKSTQSFSLEMTPNPARTKTVLHTNFETKAATTLTVMDLNGKIVNEMDLGTIKGDIRQPIKLNDYQSGVYLVRLTHGDESQVKRLIVD